MSNDMTFHRVLERLSEAATNRQPGRAKGTALVSAEDIAALLDDWRTLDEKGRADYVIINGMYFSHKEIIEWRESQCAALEPAHFPDVKDSLVHERFYTVWSRRDCDTDEDPFWRAAWWDKEDEYFFDQDGDELVLDGMLVMPTPLPDMSNRP